MAHLEIDDAELAKLQSLVDEVRELYRDRWIADEEGDSETVDILDENETELNERLFYILNATMPGEPYRFHNNGEEIFP